MRNAIALNGSFFNTQRMVLQYLTNAYFPVSEAKLPQAKVSNDHVPSST
jgi:hypothetical protein